DDAEARQDAFSNVQSPDLGPICCATIDAPSCPLGNERRIENDTKALARIVKDAERAGDVIDRIRALIRKASPRNEILDLNEAFLEVSALTDGEAIKTGVTVRTQLAPCLPRIYGHRVRLQQVMLNLIVNAMQAMSDVAEDRRELVISSEAAEEGAH